MKEEPSDAMKAFMERMKKQQEGTGVRIHHMGCGEYDFSQMFPSRRKKSLSTTSLENQDSSPPIIDMQQPPRRNADD